MYVYWGGMNSGSFHVQLLADLNNKTSLHSFEPKVYHKTKIKDIYRERKWNESIYEHIIYHKQKKYDDLLRAKNTEHKLEVAFEGLAQMSDINTKTTWVILSEMYAEKFRKFSDRRKYKLKHDIEEYSKIKYIGSLIYYKLLIQNSEELCDPLGYKMVNDNAEEIFDGVDAIVDTRNNLLTELDRNSEQVFPENVLKILRSSVNIVPYKTNLLDSVISKLDSFSHDIRDHPHIKKGTLYETYENNKPFLWRFLDSYQTNLDNTISTLRKNNIPYQMFDLDNDNYTDVYKGWDIQLPRDYTHLKQCWVGCEENYKEVEKMAKEYLSLTKNKSPYRMV